MLTPWQVGNRMMAREPHPNRRPSHQTEAIEMLQSQSEIAVFFFTTQSSMGTLTTDPQ